MGTLNVALAACREGVRRLVLVSSSEVYGSARFTPINEDHPLQAQSPYAASKVAAEQVVLSLLRSSELAATIVRPFNTYGPRQTARAVVPMILSQAVVGSSVQLGSLWPRWDLTHPLWSAMGLDGEHRAHFLHSRSGGSVVDTARDAAHRGSVSPPRMARARDGGALPVSLTPDECLDGLVGVGVGVLLRW